MEEDLYIGSGFVNTLRGIRTSNVHDFVRTLIHPTTYPAVQKTAQHMKTYPNAVHRLRTVVVCTVRFVPAERPDGTKAEPRTIPLLYAAVTTANPASTGGLPSDKWYWLHHGVNYPCRASTNVDS